jgi:hypothetical protein
MKVIAAIRAWCGEHKKLTATIVGALVALVPDNVLDADRRKWVVEMVMLYVGGQAIADHGKEAVKEQVKAGVASGVVRYPAGPPPQP